MIDYGVDLDKDYKLYIDVGNEINSYVWEVDGLKLRSLLNRLTLENMNSKNGAIVNENEMIMINKINRVHWREDKGLYHG